MRLVDADRLKGILEYGILCNVPVDAVNTKEEKLNDWVQEVVDKAPTVDAIVIPDNVKHPVYYDTDSVIEPSKVKQMLNSLYGKESTTIMKNKQYITVAVDKKPMIIFIDKIISVTKSGDRAEIQCLNDVVYYTDTPYVNVVAKLFK